MLGNENAVGRLRGGKTRVSAPIPWFEAIQFRAPGGTPRSLVEPRRIIPGVTGQKRAQRAALVVIIPAALRRFVADDEIGQVRDRSIPKIRAALELGHHVEALVTAIALHLARIKVCAVLAAEWKQVGE